VAVYKVCYDQGRNREQGEGWGKVEIESKVFEVKVPRLCSVKLGTTFRATKNVVADDIPWDNGDFSVG
jgi:hypothetical protein